MQLMWICLLSGKQFEETFENAHWRKVKQLQTMQLCIILFKRFNTCIWKHTPEKSQINATNVTMPLIGQAIWRDIWKRTVEKSQTLTNVTLSLLVQAIWGHIWERTVEKSQTNATNVTLPALTKVLWEDIWRGTVKKVTNWWKIASPLTAENNF